MKLADRYILSELAGPLFLAAVGFALFMMANILFLLAEQIAVKQIPWTAVLEMLFLRVPAVLVTTFPVAMLFAALLGLGKLAADHELTAMRTGGIPFFRLSLPVFGLAVFLVFFTFLANEKISPWATRRSEDIVRRILMRQALPPVEPDVFLHGPDGAVFYVGALDRAKKTFFHVMIFEPSASVYPRMTLAGQARYDRDRLILYRGSIHQYAASGLTQYEASFNRMMIPVTLDPALFQVPKTPFEMSAAELRRQIAFLKQSGISTQALSTEYYFKWSLPFGCLAACFIGIPLGMKYSRGGRLGAAALAVLLLFAYYCCFAVSRALGVQGILPSWTAAWAPNVLFGAAGLAFLLFEERIR